MHQKAADFLPSTSSVTRALHSMPQRDGPPQSCNTSAAIKLQENSGNPINRYKSKENFLNKELEKSPSSQRIWVGHD